MFVEGCIYDKATEDDGARCLVMRLWPRGVAQSRIDVWLKELGPLPAYLKDLDSRTIHWGQFIERYVDQLRAHAASITALEQLHQLEAGVGKVTLLCHEKEYPCHRYILLDYLAGRM